MVICQKAAACTTAQGRASILAYGQRLADRHHHWLTVKALGPNGEHVLWSKVVRPR